MISVINNVLAAIRKKVEQIISDGNIFVNITSWHSNAEMTFPSRGGMVVFLSSPRLPSNRGQRGFWICIIYFKRNKKNIERKKKFNDQCSMFKFMFMLCSCSLLMPKPMPMLMFSSFSCKHS
jgi:hypothetical protein